MGNAGTEHHDEAASKSAEVTFSRRGAKASPPERRHLFLWGTVELFIVDKTLRPKLVGGPIKLPFLPTFFGLIGGVKTMGLLGLFIGPVLMAILVAIWREWLHEVELTAEPAPDVAAGPEIEAEPVAKAGPAKATIGLKT